jgi:general secretion pathway protein K
MVLMNLIRYNPLAFNKSIHRQKGIALLSVLVLVSICMILLGYVSNTIDKRLQLANQARLRLDEIAQEHAVLSQIIYLHTTQRITQAGLSLATGPSAYERSEEGYWLQATTGDELRLDGVWYRVSEPGDTDIFFQYSLTDSVDVSGDKKLSTQQADHSLPLLVSFQDQAGLLPINSGDPSLLKLWLKSKQVSLVEQSALVEQLADYADADEWRRPAGAEKREYEDLGLTAPPNFLLQTCSELYRIPAWQKFLQQISDLDWCGTSRAASLNLNAIPVTLWRSLWPDSADKIIKQRQENRWLSDLYGLLMIEPQFVRYPENSYKWWDGSNLIVGFCRGNQKQRWLVKRGSSQAFPFRIYPLGQTDADCSAIGADVDS